MLKVYKCADGFTRRFEEGTQPADASLVETKAKEPEKKTAPKKSNKAKKPANKAKKAETK